MGDSKIGNMLSTFQQLFINLFINFLSTFNVELDQTCAEKKKAWFGRKYLLNPQEAPTTNQLFQEAPLLDYEQLNPAQLIKS